jgi:hypothetical protein
MPMIAEDTATCTKPLADCAWCGAEFINIVELLTHVEGLHLDLEAVASPATYCAIR